MLKRLKGKLNDAVKKTNKKIALVLSAAVVTVTCCGFVYATPNEVTIVDSDSTPVQIKTTDTNVGKILSKQGIILNEGDRVITLTTAKKSEEEPADALPEDHGADAETEEDPETATDAAKATETEDAE